MTYECVCDFDMPEFQNTYRRKARKAHRCEECSAPIMAGETYRYDVGKWEGEILHFRTCQPCDDLAKWARISMPCFCYVFGALHESAREMVREVRKDVPGFVMEWGRRMVAIRRANRAKAVLQ
ncbi:hypothetical protein ACFPOB_26045 [Bosea eneae]|uniref:Uncharacterized protein n=1 Tax=Bosea eneae TaxID=151454 RepID=A0ABW0J0T5_9HYPH